MNRFVCIHGHFYQPPRENPWLEEIEIQDSAAPYHDWNERVTAECYAPNAVARILDAEGRIVRMVNNYACMSFDFGPTLLAWLKKNSPVVYEAVLAADKESAARFSGHGSALAQAYNHIIMPLANRRDKRTQIVWGIEDFVQRFKRPPEGMWLPETAVDLETLDIMAQEGILFTILAPHQAARIRRRGESKWQEPPGGVDTGMPYEIELPSGGKLALFFYDAALARAVAFERLLDNGEQFVNRLLQGVAEQSPAASLVHIATDGETYGHHHRFGDMALAYALQAIQQHPTARLTNYGEYLEHYPPTHQVSIHEHTSWSCVHGVERWRSDCGCMTRGKPGWHQRWRAPLRNALDGLRDKVAPLFEKAARGFLKDPWPARDRYCKVIIERSESSRRNFLAQNALTELSAEQRRQVFKLLELQRHCMLMYTSCGWFFDDISGIEAVQVLRFAGRVLQLTRELFGLQLQNEFLQELENAPSNISEMKNGRQVFQRCVQPALFDLQRVGAHYAVSSLFVDYPEEKQLCCYLARRSDLHRWEAGNLKLCAGKVELTSTVTTENARLCFAALHMGDHNLSCGIKQEPGQEEYEALIADLASTFSRADIPATLRTIDSIFGSGTYTLGSLFRDEQRKVLDTVLSETLEDIKAVYRRLYERHAPLMRFLRSSQAPAPAPLYAAADIVLHAELEEALAEEPLRRGHIEQLLEQCSQMGVALHSETLEYVLRKNLERMAEGLNSHPAADKLLELKHALTLLEQLPFKVNLWQVQNSLYRAVRLYARQRPPAKEDIPAAASEKKLLLELCEKVGISTQQVLDG